MTVDPAPPAGSPELHGPLPVAPVPPPVEERGCRCGRKGSTRAASGPPAPPLLRDDLLIAARQRNREPELPAATVEAALAAPIPSEVARYDLIRLPGDGADAARLLGEFARRGHRVFWLERAGEPLPTGFPAGTLVPVPPVEPPAGAPEDTEAVLARLADARREYRIEAAVLYVVSARWLAAARAARERWGWRVVSAPTSLPRHPAGTRPDRGSGETEAPGADAAGAAGGVDQDATASADVVVGGSEGLDVAARESWPARWAALSAGVRLCNARGVHEASTAELALALILASLRGIPRFVRGQRREEWHGGLPSGARRQVGAHRRLRLDRRRHRGPARALRSARGWRASRAPRAPRSAAGAPTHRPARPAAGGGRRDPVHPAHRDHPRPGRTPTSWPG